MPMVIQQPEEEAYSAGIVHYSLVSWLLLTKFLRAPGEEGGQNLICPSQPHLSSFLGPWPSDVQGIVQDACGPSSEPDAALQAAGGPGVGPGATVPEQPRTDAHRGAGRPGGHEGLSQGLC